jgi:hypothetical protein
VDSHTPHPAEPDDPERPEAAVADPNDVKADASTQLPWAALAASAFFGAVGLVLAFSALRAEPPAAAPSPAVRVASPAPVTETATRPVWTGSRQARWAQDGSRTIAFELEATHDVPAWMSTARPVLVVRCLYRATEAFVILDTSASFEAETGRRTVQVQWDDEPAAIEMWEVSESGRELFAADGKRFVHRLARAHRLRFGFTPFNAQPVTAEFALQGFDELAPLVGGTCGWRLDSQSTPLSARGN